MHANDPSIQLTVFILETMLITFRFSYKIGIKLEVIAISSLHRSHHCWSKAGKKRSESAPTSYFDSGKPPSVHARVWNELKADSPQNKFRRGIKMNFGSCQPFFPRFWSIPKPFLLIDSVQTPPSHRYLVREAEGAPVVTKQLPTDSSKLQIRLVSDGFSPSIHSNITQNQCPRTSWRLGDAEGKINL